MSGDLQTRQRRKEKRKQKRDEPTIGVDTSNLAEIEKKNVQMHISEDDHDVGWCAKTVFFILMAILTGLVVLILLENRGGSDLDTPVSESRFSEYFKGFVEEPSNHDDEHDQNLENFANDVLEDEKDSNHDEDDQLNAEADMLSEADLSPEEEYETVNEDPPSIFEENSTFEDSTPFEEEEEEEEEIEVEDFVGSNDDGEDLLLEKLSEQAKQDFEDAEERFNKDNDDETESPQISEAGEAQTYQEELQEANIDEDVNFN